MVAADRRFPRQPGQCRAQRPAGQDRLVPLPAGAGLPARHRLAPAPPWRRAGDRRHPPRPLQPPAAVRRQRGADRPSLAGGVALVALHRAQQLQRLGPLHGLPAARRPSGGSPARFDERPAESAAPPAGAERHLMPTLRRYVARQFGTNMGLMLLAFVSLLQLLDLLANADDIVKLHGTGLSAFLRHAMLNTPEIATVVTPICALLASLLTLARLALGNEVLALKAAGLPYYRLLWAFAPVALIVGVAHFLVSDQLTPPAARALLQWDSESPRAKLDTKIKGGFWIRDGDTLVRVSRVSQRGSELTGLTLFQRDKRGEVVLRLAAESAGHHDGAWQLRNVERLALTQGDLGTITTV